jgi:23S rRNA pseudouridine2457 synthase
MQSRFRYFAVYKPYGMVSRFSREGDRPVLADLSFDFPKDVYPIGRLDADSEGLLLLSNDSRQNSRLLDPSNAHEREYLVQVEGEVTSEALSRLRSGVEISIDGRVFRTAPCRAIATDPPLTLPERHPPVRFRKSIPTSWLSLSLTEGKNRQVRRMTAVVGFPTLRLVRVRIGSLILPAWNPGAVVELDFIDFRKSMTGRKHD